MNHWHFKLWDVLGLYIAAFVMGASIIRILLAPSSSFVADLGMYLLVLAMLLVSANVFYRAQKKNATTQRASDMSRWNFALWHVSLLYGAALIIGIIGILPSLFVGDLLGGKLAIILAMLIISANLFYRARRKNATDAG